MMSEWPQTLFDLIQRFDSIFEGILTERAKLESRKETGRKGMKS
mgnify:CR=1 FL=1